VSGVECFQVLFGLDDDGDGLPNQFLSASAIKQQADRAPGDGSSVRRVVAVQVALVLRSAVSGSKPPFFPTADLFGHTYTQTNSATDVGTAHCPVSLSASLSSRGRRRVESIIFSSDRESLK
jgi:type IV pilus assembly protein PilW